MRNFKKLCNWRIISLVLVPLFLCVDSAYSLRVPLDVKRPGEVMLSKGAPANDDLQQRIDEIADRTQAAFIVSVSGDNLQEQKDLLIRYSRLKHCFSEEINFFSDKIVKEIKKKLSIKPEEWIVCCEDLRAPQLKRASYLIAEEVARKLGGLSLVRIGLKRPFFRSATKNYFRIGSVDERESAVRNTMFLKYPEKVKNKKILFLDDCFITGGVIKDAVRVLLEAGADEIVPCVAVKFEGINLPRSTEDRIDSFFIIDEYGRYSFKLFSKHLLKMDNFTMRIVVSFSHMIRSYL